MRVTWVQDTSENSLGVILWRNNQNQISVEGYSFFLFDVDIFSIMRFGVLNIRYREVEFLSIIFFKKLLIFSNMLINCVSVLLIFFLT